MPTVGVKKVELFERLGHQYTDEEFDELCFAFGIELDEITTEAHEASKMAGGAEGGDGGEGGSGETGGEAAEEDIVYKIDIPANRYDLLCIEGLVRGLKVFLGEMETPIYVAHTPEVSQRMVVAPETADVRPFVVCAILRNVTFTQESYNSFIDLQDKLHHNICRRRTLVAIGTHDLDTISGPFTYEALPPTDIDFVALNKDESHTAAELMEIFETDNKLKKFLHIIRDKPRYPVIYDANRTVLSMPPIINGDHSKIRLTTQNVLIECTATDRTKANIVLNTVVTMFSEYCGEAYSCETVEVEYPDGSVDVTPDLSTYQCEADIAYINRSIGISESPEAIQELLKKMQLSGNLTEGGAKIVVDVPVTRSDILHECDVMEDVAVAYGFNNIEWTIPQTLTVGRQLPINKFSDLIRLEVAQAGFTEVLTLALCSRDENFTFLNHPDEPEGAVAIANPKTIEFQVARTSLMPGLLKTMACNKKEKKPVKIFEVSDVVLVDPARDVGAGNQRRFAAMYCSTNSGFENIHGLLDRVMQVLGVSWAAEPQASTSENGEAVHSYACVESDDGAFLAGRRADVMYDGAKIGSFGIVHPTVLANFELDFPCSYLEINVEALLVQ